MGHRQDTWFELSSRLALMEDLALLGLLRASEPAAGWGCSRVLTIGDTRVFTKSVPLTRREHARPYCTANLFELPTFYNYGVGSAGFGVFRELASHVKTTNWVLSGAIDAFPLMYHHRILPRTGSPPVMTAEELDKYVAFWNGDEGIRSYMQARQEAEYEVVIFLEYVPDVLKTWLPANQDALPMVMAGMQEAISFLRARGVVHFDAHLSNILTDGAQVFLTDFGLVLDAEFDLDETERAFLQAHRHYDSGEFIACLARLDLTPRYAAALGPYQEVTALMKRFFTALRTGSKLEGGYDDETLERLLLQATPPAR